MHDYYYCIFTGPSPLQHKDKVPAEAPLTNFRVNLEEISGPVMKLCRTFWSGAVSWSSVIWCTTSQADTLLQENEFFSISILIYDLSAIFSFYKILKISSCGAVHFFKVYPCVNFFLSFSLLDSK